MNNNLSPKELAILLNVPVNTIYYWISKNEIPYIKMGKHIRFSYDEVMEHFKVKTIKHSKSKDMNGLQK
ncbi:MAG: helix-turn-helix domain-containing protein [Bdellovibrionota bacterium]|nr:helix-turn-helix domain-containing protein [Bdellovibrionota bacterium]